MAVNQINNYRNQSTTYYQQIRELPLGALEASVPIEWQIGDVILDLYEITGILGQGGMGKVFKVHHRGWNVDIAVKSPHPNLFTNIQGHQDFLRECETWVNLELHPYIASCYYVRTLGGIPRIFAEYLEGGSLEDWIQSGKLYEGGHIIAIKRILDISIQTAWGLQYAHNMGLVHQDVKPHNVLMAVDGTAKITDFGLARATEIAGGEVQAAGSTPAYCSPEQARREPLTMKTDIWSWGLVVLEMFAGGIQWQFGQGALEYIKSIENNEWEIDPRVPILPSKVAAVLHQCFCDDPKERPDHFNKIITLFKDIYLEETGDVYFRTDPESVELRSNSLNNRAVSLMDLGNETEARKSWEEALEKDPFHLESTYNYGLVRWRASQGTDSDLINKINKALESHPETWWWIYLVSQINMERGNCQEVIKDLESETVKKDEHKEVRALLSKAQELLHFSRLEICSIDGGFSPVAITGDGHIAISSWGIDMKVSYIRIWDLATRKCLFELAGHRSSPCTTDISSDQMLAVTAGGTDLTIKLWDIRNGKWLRNLEGHSGSVNQACFSYDQEFVFSASDDATVRKWQAKTGRCQKIFKHENPVSSISVSKDNKWIVSGDWQGISIWNSESGELVNKIQTENVWSVYLNHDSRSILVGEGANNLRLREFPSGRMIKDFIGHGSDVKTAFLAQDGLHAVSASMDNTTRLWDLNTGRCLWTKELYSVGNQHPINMSSKDLLISASCRLISVMDIGLGYPDYQAPFVFSTSIETGEAGANKVEFQTLIESAEEALILNQPDRALSFVKQARSKKGFERDFQAFKLWKQLHLLLGRSKLNAVREFATISENYERKEFVDISLDGHWAATVSDKGTVTIWDLINMKFEKTIPVEPPSQENFYYTPGLASFFPDSKLLAIPGFLVGSQLQIYDIYTSKCIKKMKPGGIVYTMALSSDGRHALFGGFGKGEKYKSGWIELYNIENQSTSWVMESKEPTILSVAISLDGQYALSGGLHGILELWNLNNGHLLRSIISESTIWCICFSLDNRHAYTGTSDDIQSWDLQSGKCLFILKGHKGIIKTLNLSQDGRYLVSGGEDGSIQIWDLRINQLAYPPLKSDYGAVNSVCLSPDQSLVLAGYAGGKIVAWELEWNLVEKQSAEWDEGARPILERFLVLHPMQKMEHTGIFKFNKPRKYSSWTEADFQLLLQSLKNGGYGWLRPEGIKKELEKMANH